jgi:hypothetical protein
LRILTDEHEKYLKDKRIEHFPKSDEMRQSHTPLKSVMTNIEKIAAKGGIALHYDMTDLCSHRLSPDYNDERPISPTKHERPDSPAKQEQVQKQSFDRRDRKARESMVIKRKKLDSVVVRRPAKEDTKSMYVERTDKRPNSSHMLRKKQMSRAHARKDDKTNTRIYQLATSPRKETIPKKPYLKRKKYEISKTLLYGQNSLIHSKNDVNINKMRENRERKYYRQEDVIGQDFYKHKGAKERLHEVLEENVIEDTRIKHHFKMSDRDQADHEGETLSFISRHRIGDTSGQLEIAKHDDSVIDRHQLRQRQYGLTMPQDQL